MRRRDFVTGALTLSALALGGRPVLAAKKEQDPTFRRDSVRQLAKAAMERPYKAPDSTLPEGFGGLDYDAYRGIRFRPDRAIWHGEKLGFELQLFHRGFLFEKQVEIYIVDNGIATRIDYDPALFTFEPGLPEPPKDPALGFAGFRIHAPINRPDYYDEIAVFLGASYFRAVAKGQVYGISARGLAIGTAAPEGEEFPAFRAFWIEKPQPGATDIVVYGLLDGPSTAGAYRFTIRPGAETRVDVESTLYPRQALTTVGLAPLTSMFYFGSADQRTVDDYRPAVHDSSGLAIRTGRGESIWRPLVNPEAVQVSAFLDENPMGFGLMQRERGYRDFLDLEAAYERRPSAWVEPVGAWGKGYVALVELPTRTEYEDNIVAFWRPEQPLPAGAPYDVTYRLTWLSRLPQPEIATVRSTRTGGIGGTKDRLFVIDFDGPALETARAAGALEGVVVASAGTVQDVVVYPNSETGGQRLSFRLSPGETDVVELTARLKDAGGAVISESWAYRWVAVRKPVSPAPPAESSGSTAPAPSAEIGAACEPGTRAAVPVSKPAGG